MLFDNALTWIMQLSDFLFQKVKNSRIAIRIAIAKIVISRIIITKIIISRIAITKIIISRMAITKKNTSRIIISRAANVITLINARVTCLIIVTSLRIIALGYIRVNRKQLLFLQRVRVITLVITQKKTIVKIIDKNRFGKYKLQIFSFVIQLRFR